MAASYHTPQYDRPKIEKKDHWFSILTGVLQIIFAVLFQQSVDYGDYEADINTVNEYYPCKWT